MASPLLIHLCGVPGSGKSAIAYALAPRLDAVVLNHHVIEAPLLKSELDRSKVGAISQRVLTNLARDILEQNRSVIVESPYSYEIIATAFRGLAEARQAMYRFLACSISDINELDRRLRTRRPLPNQVRGIKASEDEQSPDFIDAAQMTYWMSSITLPKASGLVLDAIQPVDQNVERALIYILGDGSENPRSSA